MPERLAGNLPTGLRRSRDPSGGGLTRMTEMRRMFGNVLGVGRMTGLIASSGITGLLTITYIIYVGRALGQGEYADFAAALSLIYFVGLAFSPLTPTVGRLVAQFAAADDHAAVAGLRTQMVTRTAFISATLAAVGLLLSPVVGELLHFRSRAVPALAFMAIALFAIISVDRGFVHGLLEFRIHNINAVTEAAVRLLLTVVLMRLWRSAAAPMVGYVAGIAIAELALLIHLRSHFRATARAPVQWKEVRAIALPIAALMLALAVFQNADMLVVKRYLGRESAGAYGAATALVRGIAVLFVPLYVAIGPILASRHASSQPIFTTTLRFTALFAAMSAVAILVFAVWPATIVGTLYGPSFLNAAPLLAPLTGVVALTFTALMLSQALITLREFRFIALWGLFAVLQVLVLLTFHDTLRQVIVSLYAVQGLTFVMVAVFFANAAWRRRSPPAI